MTGGPDGADPAPAEPGPGDSGPGDPGPGDSGPGDPGPGDPGPGGPAGAGTRRPSGLRNPAAAVRGLGAGTLVIEALVLLLAIQPIRVLGGALTSTAVAVVIALAVLAIVLSGLIRRRWAWWAATALPGLLLLAGLLHWSLAVLGVIFAVVWGYVLHVRQTILG